MWRTTSRPGGWWRRFGWPFPKAGPGIWSIARSAKTSRASSRFAPGSVRASSRPSLGKPPQPEARDVVLCRAGRGEIGDDFADHRRELESVAGARRRHDDLRVRLIDDEVAVRRHRVKAGLGVQDGPVGLGQILFQGGTDERFVGGRHALARRIRINSLVGVIVLCKL